MIPYFRCQTVVLSLFAKISETVADNKFNFVNHRSESTPTRTNKMYFHSDKNDDQNLDQAVDLTLLPWPNAITRTVFKDLCLKEAKRVESDFKIGQNWFRLVFEQTDFTAYSVAKLQEELSEFYDFAVLDFLEIVAAAKNNPIRAGLNIGGMQLPGIKTILTQTKSEIDFRFLADLIITRHGNTHRH